MQIKNSEINTVFGGSTVYTFFWEITVSYFVGLKISKIKKICVRIQKWHFCVPLRGYQEIIGELWGLKWADLLTALSCNYPKIAWRSEAISISHRVWGAQLSPPTSHYNFWIFDKFDL